MQGVLEVHSVAVHIHKTKGASNEIYGDIQIDDNGLGDMDIFKADKQHAKPLSSGCILPLSGPFRCIMGDMCVMAVSLKEKLRDLEVGYGYLSLQDTVPIDYNRPIDVLFNGRHGYSIVHLSFFENALQALVKVVLVPKGDSLKYTIFGEVSAQYRSYKYMDEYSKRYHQTRLFDFPLEKAHELSIVSRDGRVEIPLTRHAVAAPLEDELIIDTKLWFKDSGGTSKLVSGSFFFFPKVDDRGKVTKNIEGDFGSVEVSVTWLDDIYSVYNRNEKIVDDESV